MAITMSTDNADRHSVAKMALANAEAIIIIDRSITGPRRIAAEQLQNKVAEVLAPHHTNVQNEEINNLAIKGADHILTPMELDNHVKAALVDVQKAAAGTLWEDHFYDPEVIKHLTMELGNHFATSQHIERLTFATKTAPTDPNCKAYLTKFKQR
jgi:hypothetical protein